MKDKWYNYSKNNHCKCGKLISNNAVRCNFCASKRLSKYMKDKLHKLNCKCPFCKAKKGEFKGKNHPSFKNKKPKCIDCKKKICYGCKRCQKCYHKLLKGKNCPNYIDGRCSKKYYCVSCKKKITYKTWIYGTKHCKSCASKNSWKKNRNLIIKSALKGLYHHPNKPEQLLIKLFKKLKLSYNYNGNGKKIIGGFCPDFINYNGQKKIIELFGDYWHKLPNYIKRDKRRLKKYSKLGYKTLIVWEKEFKNINRLEHKILKFNRNKK